MPNTILGMTIAVQHMDTTLAFYTHLFGLRFEASKDMVLRFMKPSGQG